MDAPVGQPTAAARREAQAKRIRLPPPHSRTRIPAQVEYKAEETLELGEFAIDPCLAISEARVLVNHVLRQRVQDDPHLAFTLNNETLKKTRDYLETFSRAKSESVAVSIERILSGLADHLNHFERAQLASLYCDEATEAKELVPSIKSKIDDETLTDYLRQINTERANDDGGAD